MNQELIALLSVLPQQVEEDGSVTAYNEFIRITLEKARTFDKTSPTRSVLSKEECECEECIRLEKSVKTTIENHRDKIFPLQTLTHTHKKMFLVKSV